MVAGAEDRIGLGAAQSAGTEDRIGLGLDRSESRLVAAERRSDQPLAEQRVCAGPGARDATEAAGVT